MGPAGVDWRHPRLLDDEVVDELADVPFGAGPRRVPLVGADGVAEVAESRQGAAVQGERVHEWERLVAGLCQLGVSVARQ
jgi:hypothetical protein